MRPVVYQWTAADNAAVSIVQSAGASAAFNLNGTLSNHTNGNVVVNFFPVSRVVTLTSDSNNSLVNFTITGTNCGTTVTEIIAGPNISTVSTTTSFDSVTSVTSSAAFTNVSVGTGQTGSTLWYIHDFNKDGSPPNFGIQVIVSGTITYSYAVTLMDVQTISPVNVVSFTPIAAMTAATTNQLANYTNSVFASRIVVSASTGAATLQEIICQQGIT